jgi:eukaryotic-like serine/threonine-protein kinase
MTDAVLTTLSRALAGQYAFERELGRGGMGIVYLARDLQLDRLVAIKVLPPALADDDALARFVREARTAAQLAHPNVVPVHRADRAEGIAFFVMGFVDGEPLADRIRARGALPVDDVVRWLREVAWALAYAHARGVVHRDVKPENILLDRASGRAMVTDFGIARRTEADALTRSGLVLGTAYYMSPEQVSGDTLDGRSDLYSLGVVGFHALAGRLPFAGNAIGAVLVAHATRPAPPLASVAPHVPAAVATVIDRCLAKAPDDRYATGEALADALERALERAEAAGAPAVPAAAPVVLSETQAAALFERAARLQADALQRLDTRSAPDALRAAGAAPEGSASAATPEPGYKLEHLQKAAAEAGISEQYVALALAEVRPAAHGLVTMPSSDSWQERRAEALLGTDQRSVSMQRTLRASPRRVLRALGSALQRHPFALTLLRTVGGHPLDGGVLVFRLPGRATMVADTPDDIQRQWMGIRHQLKAEDVQVMLRQIEGDPDACQVTMFVDLRPGLRRNVNTATLLGGGLAGVTATFAAMGAKVLALTALGAVGFSAGLAAAAGAAMLLAYRPLYRRVARKAASELSVAMDAIESALQVDSVFGGGSDVLRPLAAGDARTPRPATTPRP